jgi:ankyrin repeat protein
LLTDPVPDAGAGKRPAPHARAGDNPVLRSEGGAPPLHAAAARGDAELVEQLLNEAQYINWPGAEAGANALQKLIAAMGPACPLALVQKFIAKGAHINRLDEQGNSALDYARKAGSNAIAELLSSSGACSGEEIQQCIFTVAIIPPVADGLKALLAQQSAQQSRQALDIGRGKARKTPLMETVKWGQAEGALLLLEFGASVDARDSNGDSALTLAAAEGKVPLMLLLLDKGADPDAPNRAGKNALALAATKGSPDAVMVLLLHKESKGTGMAVDAGRRKELAQQAARLAWGEQWRKQKDLGKEMEEAAEKGKLEMVRLLLDLGATGYDSKGTNQPMVDAAGNGHVAVVNMLLDHGIPADARGRYCSPLQKAAARGCLQVCETLLERGVSVNPRVPEDDGTPGTPLHCAACSFANGGPVVQFLLDRGADANLLAPNGDSALEIALRQGSQQSIRLLLDKTAYVGNKQAEHWGKLLLRYMNNFSEPIASDIVQRLIANGADVNHKDQFGMTALYYALDVKGREQIVELLRKHGAKSEYH